MTRLKLSQGAFDDAALTEAEKTRGRDFARDLSIRSLTRAWQILTKGLTEVQLAPRPIVAAEMLMVRLAYASDLPTPDEALRMLKDGAGGAAGGSRAIGAAGRRRRGRRVGGRGRAAHARGVFSLPRQGGAAPRPGPAPPRVAVQSLQQLVAIAQEKRDVLTATALRNDVRLVRLEDGVLEFGLTPKADPSIVQRSRASWRNGPAGAGCLALQRNRATRRSPRWRT